MGDRSLEKTHKIWTGATFCTCLKTISQGLLKPSSLISLSSLSVSLQSNSSYSLSLSLSLTLPTFISSTFANQLKYIQIEQLLLPFII